MKLTLGQTVYLSLVYLMCYCEGGMRGEMMHTTLSSLEKGQDKNTLKKELGVWTTNNNTMQHSYKAFNV